MRILAAALFASTITAAVPAHAALVTLRFEGTIPNVNSSFGAGIGPFTSFQNAYIANANFGSTYDFTLSYDTASTPVAGRYAMTLVSGRIGAFTDFSGFTPYIQFTPAGAYTYMSMMLQRTENLGPNLNYNSYASFSLGDNDGTVVSGVLPTTVVASEYDAIGASFDIYGANGSYRSIVDSRSRGLSQVPPGTPGAGAVPEPATWAMMIAGFGMIGGAMRRRSAKVAYA